MTNYSGKVTLGPKEWIALAAMCLGPLGVGFGVWRDVAVLQLRIRSLERAVEKMQDREERRPIHERERESDRET